MEPSRPSGKGEGNPALEETADEELLDGTLGRLLVALEADDRELVSSLWRDFESQLTARMDYEERRVTPRLEAIRLRDALAILQEHRHLRTRLKEIGESISRNHEMRLENARSFRDELRAHAGHESAILARVADAMDRSKA